ncbi:MAG TPA: NADH-quinone oxidoreductase subunit N [Deferrisomatales bacterium]|nr:NADH-quinone oxidoreductase subunit N [Deferrisomatales bacterium]
MTFVMSDLRLLTPHMIITGAALLILMLEAFGGRGKSKNHLVFVGLAGIAGAAFTTLPLLGGGAMGFSQMLAGDGFAAFCYFALYVVGALTLLVSPGYLQDEENHHGEYYALVLLALVGMMLMAGATHLLVMFLALETMSIAIYALAGYLRTPRGIESSFKYFILGAFASGFLLYGIALLYGAVGSTQLHAIAAHFAGVRGLSESPLALIGVGLIAADFLFKVAAVPFHVWTPDVYQGAPTSITGFMATGVKVAAFAAFLRVFFTAFPAVHGETSSALWLLAVLTMTMGNFAAIVQDDVKRMLAYSSIAHAGYLLVGLVVGTAEAGAGMLFYLMSYAFMNIGAFACLIMVGRKGQDNTEFEALSGLGFKYPGLGLALTLFMFSMAGIPPTAGFIGKFLIFKAAVHEGYYWLTILGVLNSAASVYFYLRVIVTLYFKPEAATPLVEKLRAGPAIIAGTACAGLAVLYLGILPGSLVDLATAALKALV